MTGTSKAKFMSCSIISRAACDNLINNCGLQVGDAGHTLCKETEAALTNAPRDGSTADAWNRAFGMETNFASVQVIDNQGNPVGAAAGNNNNNAGGNNNAANGNQNNPGGQNNQEQGNQANTGGQNNAGNTGGNNGNAGNAGNTGAGAGNAQGGNLQVCATSFTHDLT